MSKITARTNFTDSLALSEALWDSSAPLAENVWIGTTGYPIGGNHPLLFHKTERQAQAALLNHWRKADRQRRQWQQTEAKGHCILMGFDPAEFPEKFEGLPFPVKCWEDLRRFYGAHVYPVNFGEVWIDSRVTGTRDVVSDSIRYLEDEDDLIF